MTANDDEKKKIEETVKCINRFIISILILIIALTALIVSVDRIISNFNWGVLTLIFGSFLLFLSIYISLFKIIISKKFDMFNPGGVELQRMILILNIGSILIIILAFLKLMNIIPL